MESGPATLILLGCASYLLGAALAGYYLTRFLIGRDIRTIGSGNAGARNAARVLGTGPGLAVLAWDFLKGALALTLALLLDAGDVGSGIAALAVVLGHVFPPQLSLRGGKGVAPAMGALSVAAPAMVLVAGCAYVLFMPLVRDVPRRAVISFGIMAIAGWAMAASRMAPFLIAVGILLVLTHLGRAEAWFKR